MILNLPSFKLRRGKLLVTIILSTGLSILLNAPSLQAEVAFVSCEKSFENNSRLRRFAKDAVAKFELSKKPVNLSSIGFDDENGNVTTLANWQGKVVLFNLWATWCGPCRREMPALDKLQEETGDATFEVVPVSIDRGNNAKAKAFYKQYNLDALRLFSDGTTKIFATLEKTELVHGLPTSILIDKNGCALGTLKGSAEWNSDEAKALMRAAR